MNETIPSRYQVRVISPRLEPPNPVLTFEMGESDVSMRLATKELDWAPMGDVRIDRVDSETFSINLRSNEWIVRPVDVAGFLFGTRARLETQGVRPKKRSRDSSPVQSVAWAGLHGFLALSILGVGVVIGRYSLDGSNFVTGLVAILVMGVGLVWSRIVPGRDFTRSTRPATSVLQTSRPAGGGRLRGDVDVLKQILGDRVQTGPGPQRPVQRPAEVTAASWLENVELPTLEQGADDLTIIRGIGPAVASRLAGAGVVTYKQVAHLTDAEFHQLARVLGAVMHRIDLDAWRQDAKMAYEHKYGRRLGSAGDASDLAEDDQTEEETAPAAATGAVTPAESTAEVMPAEVPAKAAGEVTPTEVPADRDIASGEGSEPTNGEPATPADVRAAEGHRRNELIESPEGDDSSGRVRTDVKATDAEPQAVQSDADASPLESEFAWWGSGQSDTDEIESAWREIDDSVLILDPDEPVEAEPLPPPNDPVPGGGRKDDLTAIKGIGKATARKLAAIGVVSLAQIAEADHEQISRMEAALGFRAGRFSAERWQEQARDLLEV